MGKVVAKLYKITVPDVDVAEEESQRYKTGSHSPSREANLENMTSAVGNAGVWTSVFSSRNEKTHTLEFFKATYINAWSENAGSFYMTFSVCFLN